MRLALPLAAALAAGCTFPEYAVSGDAVAGDATVVAVLDPEGVVVETDASADTASTDGVVADGPTDARQPETGDAVSDALPPECVVSNRWIRCAISLEWGAARTFCKARGYDLLRINTFFESSQISNALLTSAPVGARYYIGLNDVATEGTYVWADGTTPSFFNWNTNEPSTLTTGNDCVALRKDGKWQTELCAGPPRPEGFICEMSATTMMDASL